MQPEISPHSKGSRARVLLSSVFGPYARDDEYGSRTINPMELYHNQVTRVQGGFSLRMFHRSFGLLILQANINAPCTVLDFPSRARFTQELQDQPYDIIGISAIMEDLAGTEQLRGLVDRLGELTRHDEARIRGDACHYLELAGDPAAAVYLRPCLKDPDAEVREVAQEALQQLQDNVMRLQLRLPRSQVLDFLAGQRAQLCLANEELRHELVKNLKARLRANPAATIASTAARSAHCSTSPLSQSIS